MGDTPSSLIAPLSFFAQPRFEWTTSLSVWSAFVDVLFTFGGGLVSSTLTKMSVISDPRRGCFMGLSMFIFLFFFFFPPRFCPAHISGTVTRRDSKLSLLLGPAV